jgi:hypothetical protein
MAQAAQFPVYFRTGSILSLFLFFSCVFSHPPSSASSSDLFQVGKPCIEDLLIS